MVTIESYVPEMHADNVYVIMDIRTAVVPDNGIMDNGIMPCKTKAKLWINGMRRINHRNSKRTPLTTCAIHEISTKIFFTKYFSCSIIMNFLHERHSRCVPLQDVTLRNISRKEGYAPK
ncbi:hypothetical protein ALC53_00497 [Atta colombica]|uniref:Uncharacterized protein n=1 Tax=Atta colombica TaxID=520822 RepID=A0A195BYE4_9HYME|nr:hypothetical protein ALC53_00497 [Atta colombica]